MKNWQSVAPSDARWGMQWELRVNRDLAAAVILFKGDYYYGLQTGGQHALSPNRTTQYQKAREQAETKLKQYCANIDTFATSQWPEGYKNAES